MHHAAQPGMGMNEPAVTIADEKVMLTRTWFYDEHVAALRRPGNRCKVRQPKVF